MDATRGKLGFASDWLTAAALLVGTVLVAALVVRELRTAPRLPPASPDGGASAVSVPAEAVSVPSLLLGGSEIKVGDSMAEANARLAPSAGAGNITVTRQGTERGPLGPREIRWYQIAAPTGTSFIVVFEPFERQGEPRVAAIYLI